MHKEVKPGRQFIGRFETGDDLLAVLTDFCQKQNIRLGTFSLIGAVTCGRLGYFDQEAKKYVECVKLDEKLEIAGCLGNISIKDGEIFPHAHITFADMTGMAYGGHLCPGTLVFAAEFHIQELTGAELVRTLEGNATGLPLWK